MQYRRLGSSGVLVSSLALGTLPFGGHQRPEVGHTSVAEARRILDHCISVGVNLVDTADKYGYGRAEEAVGEIISGRRDHLIIATKCGSSMSDDPNDIGSSRRHILESVKRSLRRLGTDYIDLYQMHQWDGKTTLEETLGALDELVRSGLVRYIGCSNFAAWQFTKALGISDRLGLERFVSHQIYYSAIGREAEIELIPSALDQSVSILVWSPLAGGLLGGKFGRRQAKGGEEMKGHFEPPVPDPDRVLDSLDVLEQIATDHHASVAQVSLAYLLGRPGVTSVIIGPRTLEHTESALRAVDLSLSSDEVARIDEVTSQRLPYPFWHQVRSSSDRFSAADETVLLQVAAKGKGHQWNPGSRP